MQDEPTPAEILTAVTAFLRDEILPQISGSSAFQLRVASNALDLVRRQLSVAAEFGAQEQARLRALLQRDGNVEELTAELARRIANGSIDTALPELEAFLWQTTEEKLEVDQPQYAGLARARKLRADASKIGEM